MAQAVLKFSVQSREFQQAMKSMTAEMKQVSSAYSLAAAQAKLNGSQSDALKAKVTELTSKMEKQKSVVELNQTQAKNLATHLDDLKSKHAATGEKVDAARKKYEECCEAQGKNSEEAKALKEELDKLEAQYEREETTIKKTETALTNQEAAVTKAEAALVEMEAELKEVNAELARQKFDEYAEKAEKVGTAVQNAGKKMTVATGAIVGVATPARKTTADFDSQMSTVKSISGATGKEFDALREKAIEMGSKTSFSASEAGAAMEYMAMAGWKTEDMIDGISGVMNAAAASGEDLAATSDILTDGLTAFGLSAKDSARFADVLVAASNNANTNVSMMGETFKYAGAVCGSLGISVEDCAIATGLMGNAGIKASNAGTALRTGLSNLVKPTDEMAAAMEKYGVSVQTTDDGSVDFMATMKNVREALGSLDSTTRAAATSTIFGKNAMSGWSAIITATDEDFDKLTDAIYNCDGAAQEAADIKLDNLNGQITILKSTIEGIAIQIGDLLMPIVREAVSKMQEWASWFSALDDKQKTTIVTIAGIVAAIGPLLLAVGKMITFSASVSRGLGTLSAAFAKMGFSAVSASGSTGAFTTILSAITSPVGIAVAAAGALAAGLGYVAVTNDEVRGKLQETVGTITGAVTTAFNNIAQTVIPDMKAAWAGILDVMEPVKEFVAGALTSAWNDILIPAMQYIGQTVIPTLETTFLNLWNNALVPLGQFVGSTLKPAFETLADVMTALWENAIIPIADAVGGVLSTAWDGLFSVMNDKVIPAVNSIIGFFEKHKTLTTSLAAGIGAFTLVMKAHSIAQTAVSVATGIMTAATTAWNVVAGAGTAVTTAFGAAMAFVTSPVTLIALAIAGLVAAGVALYKNWDTVSAKAKEIWGAISEFFSGVWEGIKGVFSSAAEAISGALSTAWDAISGAVTTAWTAIRDFFVGQWEEIKSVVQFALLFIQEIISAAFQLITLPFRMIWENCKGTVIEIWDAISSKISAVWETIKNTVTTAINAVKTTLSNIWNTIKTTVTTIWDAISSKISAVWETIKNAVTTAINAVKTTLSNIWNSIATTVSTVWNSITSTISSVWGSIKSVVSGAINSVMSTMSSIWNSIKSTTSSIWNGIKSAISTPINAAKTTISDVINGIKSTMSNAWNAVKSTATSVWNSIKSAITTPIEAAKNAVHNAIEAIKNKFNFSWSLPKLKLPHLNISGSFSLTPPSVPKFSIEWYKSGGIMTQPTLFGGNGTTLFGGGEAGAEAILPLAPFYSTLARLLDDKFAELKQTIHLQITVVNEMDGEVISERTSERVIDKVVGQFERRR